MGKLKKGDRVDCRIRHNTIVSPYEGEYDETITFDIVGLDSEGYYLYIPHYLFIKGSVALDKHACNLLGVSRKFLGEYAIYVSENMIYRINKRFDGIYCVRCGEFCYMAEPNQENGTLICWVCRAYPHH